MWRNNEPMTILVLMAFSGLTTTFAWTSSRLRLSLSNVFLKRYHSSSRIWSSSQIDDMTGWTVDQATRESMKRLAEQGVSEPEQSVQHLLAVSLGLSWESGFREVVGKAKNEILKRDQAEDFADKLKRRMKHEPLQYILGHWDFLSYTKIAIKAPLLCPRPETEELVMMIVEDTTESPIHILDVGCGTGVIGLALAEMIPDASVEAIDCDSVAVETSMENAKRILDPSQISCYKATLCSAQDYVPDHRFDIVVSNPPYIPQDDMATLSADVRNFESWSALCGGEDGLDIVRVIVRKLPHWCNSGAVCWMEVDPTHPRKMKQWIQDEPSLGVDFEDSYKDLFGRERFVKLRVL
jgi:release factor glutamine methyltransferase